MSDEPSAQPLVAVVVLNWNGGHDTIACLKSLAGSTYSNLRPIVVDNGSTDDSLVKLRAWRRTLAGNEGAVAQIDTTGTSDYEWTRSHGLRPKPDSKSHRNWFLIIENGENLGFAAGNNVGLRLALVLNADFIWLLNNDTEVDRRCLEWQINLLQNEKSIDCLVPVILVRDAGGIVWNCGGKLLPGGLRRYLYAGVGSHELPQSGWQEVSLVTGCSLLLRKSVILTGGLLCEDFFFGEEDLEFSIRLRRLRKRAACSFEARVIHRVSGTFAGPALQSSMLGRVYIYYLNRFVHLRKYRPRLWVIWRLTYVIYIVLFLRRRYSIPWRVTRNLVARLKAQSQRLDVVSREVFLDAIHEDFTSVRNTDSRQ